MAEDSVFTTVETALDDLRSGRFVIVAESRDPEGVGDLLVAAEKCTPAAVNFIVTEAIGIVFLCLPVERVEALRLPPMAPRGESRTWTQAMTVSIEARHGVTTGISAHDRARTIQVAIDPGTVPSDLGRPGHVFPLVADADGVLGRAGRTEAHVDLTRSAGLVPGGVASEIVTQDGAVARLTDLIRFARRHGIRIVTVDDVVRYRWDTEQVLARSEETRLPTRFGEFTATTFLGRPGGERHIVLVRGAFEGQDDVDVSVHTECLVGDVFGSVACGCSPPLEQSLRRLGSRDRGVLVYVGAATPHVLSCGPRNPEHVKAVASQVLSALGIRADRIRCADASTTELLEGKA